PGQRRKLGLAFVPEERLGRGAVPGMSLADNALLTAAHSQELLAGGFLRFERARDFAQRCIEAFNVKSGGPDAAAKSLSGGNLQKFIVGREILQAPKLLVCAQPTWGVDVGAAAFIRQALIDLRDRGCAVLVISEELDELFEVCDRIAVIAKGRLSPTRPAAETTVEDIGVWMSGMWPGGGPGPPHAAPPLPTPPAPLKAGTRSPRRTRAADVLRLAAACGGADAGRRHVGVCCARQGPGGTLSRLLPQSGQGPVQRLRAAVEGHTADAVR